MHIFRTRIKNEIVSEFLPPVKPSRRVIILCEGMPSYPYKKDLMIAMAQKGYWVFLPRYRGTWESGGSFLKKSPHQDILDVINQLPKGFPNLWDGKIQKIKNPIVYLIGSSFGGPAALLASKHKNVKRVVALSPVIDWTKESKIEPLDWLARFTKKAFGNGYRFSQKDWNKLKPGKFYNPAGQLGLIDAKKVFIIHSEDDEIVDTKSVKDFAKKIGCKILLLKKGGHLSFSKLITPPLWNKVRNFISN